MSIAEVKSIDSTITERASELAESVARNLVYQVRELLRDAMLHDELNARRNGATTIQDLTPNHEAAIAFHDAFMASFIDSVDEVFIAEYASDVDLTECFTCDEHGQDRFPDDEEEDWNQKISRMADELNSLKPE